jgi:hypothetical protein
MDLPNGPRRGLKRNHRLGIISVTYEVKARLKVKDGLRGLGTQVLVALCGVHWRYGGCMTYENSGKTILLGRMESKDILQNIPDW